MGYKDNKTDRPVCWDWEIPDEVWYSAAKVKSNKDVIDLFMFWCPVCSVCGRPDEMLVLDHDHSSWLIRGLLCESCNGAEHQTIKREALFDNYRHINPAYLLGLEIKYTRLGKYNPRQLNRAVYQELQTI